jgi:hypothetical protein
MGCLRIEHTEEKEDTFLQVWINPDRLKQHKESDNGNQNGGIPPGTNWIGGDGLMYTWSGSSWGAGKPLETDVVDVSKSAWDYIMGWNWLRPYGFAFEGGGNHPGTSDAYAGNANKTSSRNVAGIAGAGVSKAWAKGAFGMVGGIIGALENFNTAFGLSGSIIDQGQYIDSQSPFTGDTIFDPGTEDYWYKLPGSGDTLFNKGGGVWVPGPNGTPYPVGK